MAKQYMGSSKAIYLDGNSLVIRSTGFSSSKKAIQLSEISNVALGIGPTFSRDTVEIHYTHGVEKIRFSTPTDAKSAADDIASSVKRSKQSSPLGDAVKFGASVFGLGGLLTSLIAGKQERQQEQALQEAETAYREAANALINSGKLSTTTYINGKELKRPTSKDDIKAVFIAEYAKSPRTVEQPWAQSWADQYGIRDVRAYLQSVVNEGYLEKAVLGKALSTLSGEQLKSILSKLSMKASGTKIELIQRLVEEADSNRVQQLLPTTIYALSKKGEAFLRAKQPMLAEIWIDSEKAIERGINVAPDFNR